MTCQTVSPMLSQLLDRELSPQQAAEVEAHLASCEKCRILRQDWSLQGLHLRNHLRRYALGEDFVSGVLCQVHPPGGSNRRASEFSLKRKRLVRWLPAAAAVVAAVFLGVQFFRISENTGYARVIDPGPGLEIMPSSSTVWLRGAAGELLAPGDWMRNPVTGTARILWHDSCSLTLESGTLARFPAAADPGRLLLLGGELLSEISSSGQYVLVETPAGSVSTSTGRFGVRVGDVVLPDIAAGADQSEITAGTVVSIGEVRVNEGDVTVELHGRTHTIVAGQMASFSASGVAVPGREDAPVNAVLKQVFPESARGSLRSVLKSTGMGLELELDASNISLRRLLELSTGIPVNGGESLFVAGTLTFPVGARAESIVAAVEQALSLPVRCLQASAHIAVATIPRQAPAENASGAEFRLERYGNDTVSFSFRNIPAQRAFQLLRATVPDIPVLSPESVWIPVTLEAPAMEKATVAAWLGRALELNVSVAERRSDFIEVGATEDVSPQYPAWDPTVPVDRPNSPERPKGNGTSRQNGTILPPTGDRGLGTIVGEPSPAAGSGIGFADGSRPLWGILRGTVFGTGFFPGGTPNADGSSSATGKATAKIREYLGSTDSLAGLKPSYHLVWPVLDDVEAASGGAAYVVTNPVGMAAHTFWNGYNREGKLLTQFSLIVERNDAAAFVPAASFATDLGVGGHWETVSNIALIGSRDNVAWGASAPGMPVRSELLAPEASFPGWLLSRMGAQIWVVNPMETDAAIEVQLVRFGEPLLHLAVRIPAHGGFVLPDPISGITLPEGLDSGTTVVIVVRQGWAAIGMRM